MSSEEILSFEVEESGGGIITEYDLLHSNSYRRTEREREDKEYAAMFPNLDINAVDLETSSVGGDKSVRSRTSTTTSIPPPPMDAVVDPKTSEEDVPDSLVFHEKHDIEGGENIFHSKVRKSSSKVKW